MDITTKPKFFQKHPILKDICSLGSFILCVVVGTIVLNMFVFRSYNVVGQSMENTLKNDDRVIVNRFIVSLAHFSGNEYIPERGDIIVFSNEDSEKEKEMRAKKAKELGVEIDEIQKLTTCDPPNNISDQYLIKRVIAFPGERVVVKEGVLKVYNKEYPDGFVYDENWRDSGGVGPKDHTSGEVDMIVPEGEIFVSGDNREGSHSYDSRNGLGTIPFCRIVGPVSLRIFPLTKLTVF